jgi:FHA domain-containing protein
MPVLKNLESKIAGLVEGSFSRVFKSEVRPVELARKLTREMDEHRSYSLSRTYVPNEYRVYLSTRDRARFADVEDALSAELSGYLLEHARREGFALISTPVIEFVTDDQLGLGEFGIETDNVSPELEPAPASPVPGAGHTMVFNSPPRGTAVREPRSGRALLLHEGRRLVIAPAGATIGRSRQCDIVLNDPNVSREHAEVRQRGTQWFVRDLGSTNGTALNGRTLSEAEQINSGDEIEIGTSLIGFEIE